MQVPWLTKVRVSATQATDTIKISRRPRSSIAFHREVGIGILNYRLAKTALKH